MIYFESIEFSHFVLLLVFFSTLVVWVLSGKFFKNTFLLYFSRVSITIISIIATLAVEAGQTENKIFSLTVALIAILLVSGMLYLLKSKVLIPLRVLTTIIQDLSPRNYIYDE